MGAWGVLAFDNDTAADWADALEESHDHTFVEAALTAVLDTDEAYLDSDFASEALAACEVLARLQGRAGYSNSYTEPVDERAAAHRQALDVALKARASAAIDRVLGENSELRELWDDSEECEDWREAVEDLRRRVLG